MKASLSLPKKVVLYEQAVSEGIFAQEDLIPTEAKVFIVQGLVDAGFKRIAIGQYSHPKVLPQFADIDEVFRQVPRQAGVEYLAGCVNMRALERAIEEKKAYAGPDMVAFQVASSDSYAQRVGFSNVNEQWEQTERMIPIAHDAGLKVSCNIGGVWTSLITGGALPPQQPYEYVDRFIALGTDSILYVEETSVMGRGNPAEVYEFFSRILDKYPNPELHRFHYHNRFGFGPANLLAAMQAGLTQFDTCLGGGPPASMTAIVDRVPVRGAYGAKPPMDYYVSPFYAGHTPTEDFVTMCNSMGIETGIDRDKVFNLGRWMEKILRRKLWSFCLNSGL